MKFDSENVSKNDFDQFYKKTSKEKIKHLISYGLLAPSTHNTQPWLFKLTDQSCDIYINRNLTLNFADPTEKNLYISMGCLIENILIAAEYYGISSNLEYNHDKNSDLVCTLTFKNLDNYKKITSVKNSLIHSIPHRITFRGIYEKKETNTDFIKELATINDIEGIYIHIFNKPDEINHLSNLTRQGIVAVANNKGFRVELGNWMRANFSSKKDGLPGYSYGNSTIFSIVAPILMKIVNPSQIMAKKTYETIKSSSLVCVISTRNDSKVDWLNAGRIVERTLLHNIKNGLKTSISVAAVDTVETKELIQKMIGKKKIPQFLFCSGYSSYKQKPAPRYSLQERLFKN